jgi:tetratricopeptide (TPR) repeat protein
MGEYALARQESDAAQKIDPDNIEIRFNEVSILQAEGKPHEAVTALQQILKATEQKTYNPQQRASRILLMERLALMLRMVDEPEQAVAVYRDISDLDSSAGSRVAAEIIETYRGGKRFVEAQKEADLAIRKYAMDRGVRVAKASLDADMGRIENAASDVKKLLDGTDDRSIQLMLAEIYEKGKKFGEARQALDAAEKLSNEQDEKVGVWFMRGAMYEKMKNLPSAETEFRKVLAVVPDHAATLNYLGYMLTDRNIRLNEGLGLIKKALEKEPNNGAYLDSLGWAYYRLGRFAEAETEIHRAVVLSPGDPTMNDHYADALVGQRKYKEAVAVWEEALKQWETSAPADKDAAEISKVRAKLQQAKTNAAKEKAN